jgi:hypothetical protein
MPDILRYKEVGRITIVLMPSIFGDFAARVVWDAARETPAPTANWIKLLRLKSKSDMYCPYRLS